MNYPNVLYFINYYSLKMYYVSHKCMTTPKLKLTAK